MNTERTEAIAQLRKWIKPGDTVYTVLRHVSRSGMQRVIGVVLIEADGSLRHTSRLVGTALEYTVDCNRGGIKVNGCGMDMGFEVVYNLGRCLFPNGFSTRGTGPCGHDYPVGCIRTPSDVATALGAGITFHGRNGDTSGWDSDGGYALTHRWI